MDAAPNPVQSGHTGPHCAECGNPMQFAEEVKHGDKVIATRYVCFCQGTVRHVSVHTGDKTRRE